MDRIASLSSLNLLKSEKLLTPSFKNCLNKQERIDRKTGATAGIYQHLCSSSWTSIDLFQNYVRLKCKTHARLRRCQIYVRLMPESRQTPTWVSCQTPMSVTYFRHDVCQIHVRIVSELCQMPAKSMPDSRRNHARSRCQTYARIMSDTLISVWWQTPMPQSVIMSGMYARFT